MKSSSKGGLVYSTDVGRICAECRIALASCVCKARARAALVGDGSVRVSLQTKGRGGKSATLIKGLALDSIALALLGDHCELVMEALGKHGHSAKRVGG